MCDIEGLWPALTFTYTSSKNRVQTNKQTNKQAVVVGKLF